MSNVATPKRARVLTRELAAICASSSDAIIGLDPLGVIESWNPAAARLYGYRSEDIIGSNVEILVAAEQRDEEAATLRRTLHGQPVEQYDTARVAKDGSRVVVSLTISAILNAANTVVGVVMVSRRLGEPPDPSTPPAAETETDRPASDEASDAHHAQVVQAERMEVLGRLAGGVAHDFNNLLGVILNYAAFVAEELVTLADCPPECVQRCEEAQRDVGQIQQAAARATDLTHQLLAFARREVIRPQVLNLNEAVLRVEELLCRTLGEDTELSVSLGEDLWPVLADPGQIEQVLVNLAINASDAMSDTGTLRIDTANITVDPDSVAGGSPATPGRYVRLRVSDSGSGMSADVASHAFEPFYTTKGEGAGTGLGLATVYGIVTEAEATIAINSELGVGTTFTIMVPVTQEAEVSTNEPAPYERTPKGETVLVVEDEEALRAVTERIFARNGYHVLTAANGAEALTLVAGYDGEIHLLLTDVVMPKMLGKEVAARVRELRPDIEVLFMSGYAQPVLASQGRLEPGVVLLDKPFSEADLLAKAGQVLNGHFKGYETVAR